MFSICFVAALSASFAQLVDAKLVQRIRAADKHPMIVLRVATMLAITVPH
jgi:hypothetical protein